MVTRISTAANVDAIVRRMLEQQNRVNDLQMQIGTGFKSQDYVGIAQDASRLLSLQSERDRVQNYMNNNNSVTTSLKVQLTAASAIDDTARTMRSELLTFVGHDLTGTSPLVQTQIQDIQEKAFNALSQITYYLNQKVDGKYIFGGGRNDLPPVTFAYDSLSEFQGTFDGISRVFPSTRVANLVDMSFDNVNVTYGTQTFGTNTYGTVTGPAPDTFITQTLTSASFGDLVFTNVGSNGKVTSTQPGAFKSLQVGQTFLLADATGTGNNGVYTITGVSANGSTLTLDQNVTAGTEPAGAAAIKLTVPNGTTMALSGSTAGNNGSYTVKWPTNAELTAAGYNLGSGDIVNGDILFTDPPQVSSGAETISLTSTSFLHGTDLGVLQKISDTQSIKLDVTGLDPAFEKVIRGLGVLAQGDLVGNPDRVREALTFINDAIEHSSLQPTEMRSDLQSVQDRISLNLRQLADTTEQQRQFLTFLKNRADSIDKADPTETAVRLNAESQSLQVSYATLSRITNLTLLDYI